MKAVRIHQFGGPEVLSFEETPSGEPGKDQVAIQLRSIGVNFIDIYHRTGLYKVPLPFTPGMEASGVVESVGPGVTDLKPGDRVGYAMAMGSYAERSLVPSWQLIKLPDEISFETAAAALLQGMTAHYLTQSTYPIQKGDTILLHAAAGGAGLLIIQMAKQRGARVIGTVSTKEKAELARQAGIDETILYTEVDFENEVKRLTDGKGVAAVYDSVGKTTFEKSLNCLQPRGMLILFGQSSGVVTPVEPGTLAAKGSLFLTRPSLGHYTLNQKELQWRAGDVLNWIASQKLKIRIARTFPLSECAEAQRFLESRQSTGKILLTP